MKRVALSFVSWSSLNIFVAYSKRIYSSSPSLQPQIPARKSNGLFQEFEKPSSFTCGVGVGVCGAATGIALVWDYRLVQQELERQSELEKKKKLSKEKERQLRDYYEQRKRLYEKKKRDRELKNKNLNTVPPGEPSG